MINPPFSDKSFQVTSCAAHFTHDRERDQGFTESLMHKLQRFKHAKMTLTQMLQYIHLLKDNSYAWQYGVMTLLVLPATEFVLSTCGL